MKSHFKYKSLLKKLMFVFLMVLALSGLGIGAVFLPNQKRERALNNEVNIEMVAKLNDENSEKSIAEFKT